MKRIIWLLICTLLMVSCVTRRACEKKFHTQAVDSIITNNTIITLIRDTTVYINIPGDTVFSSLPQEMVSTLKTETAKSIAWIKDGRINHRLIQVDTAYQLTIKGALRNTLKKEVLKRNQKTTELENETTGWQWIDFPLVRFLIFIIIFALILYLLSNIKK